MSEHLLHRDEFAAALNTRFRLYRVGDEPVELILIQVSELQVTARLESFSILFRGPPHILLPQRTYQLDHAQMGKIELFIVPVGQNESGYEYQAVFNRLRK